MVDTFESGLSGDESEANQSSASSDAGGGEKRAAELDIQYLVMMVAMLYSGSGRNLLTFDGKRKIIKFGQT